ncbi:MAG: hypothetical protein ABIT69_01940 [Sphingomicrobium sp.]
MSAAAVLAVAAGGVPASATMPLRLVIGDSRLTYVRARAADALGDPLLSARLYAGLADSHPADLLLAHRATTAAINAGAFDLALATARRLPVDDLGLDARLLLVADALRRNRSDEALALINERTADGDGGFLAPLLRAWSENEAGRDGLKPLAGDAVTQTLVGPFVDEQRAFLLLARGKSAEAGPFIAKALDGAGGRAMRLRLAFAEGLRRAGDKQGAMALLAADEGTRGIDARRPAAKGIAIATPAAAYAELLSGIAFALLDSHEEALPIALAQTARLAAPDSSQVAILLALLLDRSERRAEALAALDGVPADDPFIGDARDAEARVLTAMGRKADAVAFARAALARLGGKAGPDDISRLGDALRDSGDHAAAADAYARAAARADAMGAGNRWSYRLLRADQLEELGRWPEARAELQAALAVAPDQPLLLNFLGYGELERGEDLVSAEAMIRKASALRPTDASITDSLGWALFKRGRLPEAIATLAKAAAGDPAQSEIHEHLGDALFTAGRRMEARFAWRAALVTAAGKDKTRLEAKVDGGLTAATAAP